MTKLEEEIFNSFPVKWRQRNPNEGNELTKAAAEVAKKYIEKAWDDRIKIFFESEQSDYAGYKTESGRKDKWLKENGIIE